MLWGSLFILKAVAGTSSSSCSRAVLWTPRSCRKRTYPYRQSPMSRLYFLFVPFMEAAPTGIQRGKAAFMERSAKPNFNVWASVVSCPFLDLNVYPWRPTGGEIFPDAKVMRAWTDKYRVAMAAQKIRQLSFFFSRASQKGGISDFFFAITCSCVHFLSHSFRIVKSPHPEDIT